MNPIGARTLLQIPPQAGLKGPDAIAGAAALTSVKEGAVPLHGTAGMSSAQAALADALDQDMKQLFGDDH